MEVVTNNIPPSIFDVSSQFLGKSHSIDFSVFYLEIYNASARIIDHKSLSMVPFTNRWSLIPMRN